MSFLLQSLLVIIFCSIFLYGVCVAGLVFKEPDICFLLAMGRWIIENGAIPSQDPFSYTQAHLTSAKPYVVYQWLYEVICYGIVKVAGGTGLLVLSAGILIFSFFVVPMRAFARAGNRGCFALFVSMLVLFSSLSHISVRPELFSFLFLALILDQLSRLKSEEDKASDKHKIDRTFVITCVIIACLWANIHVLFVLMFMLLVFLLSLQIFAMLFSGAKPAKSFYTILVATLVSFFATWLNPYGFTIWSHTIRIILDPINKTINELFPLGAEAWQSPIYYPFLLLSIIALIALFKAFRSGVTSVDDLFFRFLIPIFIGLAFQSRRLVPVSVLILAVSLASGGVIRSKSNEGESFLSRLNARLSTAFNSLSPIWASAMIFIASLGAYLTSVYVMPPSIPQGSAAFSVPVGAIKYIASNPLSGRLLNDAHYGAVMIWQLAPSPKIFVDPRYFLYDTKHMSDYWDMVLARNSWQNLLKEYRIDCIFLPANTPLVKTLSTDPDWEILYKDDTAAILKLRNVR